MSCQDQKREGEESSRCLRTLFGGTGGEREGELGEGASARLVAVRCE